MPSNGVDSVFLRFKIHKHNHLQLKKIAVPNERFDHVHLDIVVIPRGSSTFKCPRRDDSGGVFWTNWISCFGPHKTITSMDETVDPTTFLSSFREQIQKIQPAPTAHHIKETMFLLKGIHKCNQMHSSAQTLLWSLLTPVPYEIIKRDNDRVMEAADRIDGMEAAVSVDCLTSTRRNPTPLLKGLTRDGIRGHSHNARRFNWQPTPDRTQPEIPPKPTVCGARLLPNLHSLPYP